MILEIRPGLYNDFLVKIIIGGKYIATAIVDDLKLKHEISFNHNIVDIQENIDYGDVKHALDDLFAELRQEFDLGII